MARMPVFAPLFLDLSSFPMPKLVPGGSVLYATNGGEGGRAGEYVQGICVCSGETAPELSGTDVHTAKPST